VGVIVCLSLNLSLNFTVLNWVCECECGLACVSECGFERELKCV